MNDEKLVVKYEEAVNPLVLQAGELLIDSKESMAEATTLLSQVNKQNDKVKAEKERVLAPLREAAKAEKSRWDPIEKVLKSAIEILRDKASVYQTAETKRVKEEEEKLAGRVGKGKGKLKMETAARKAGEIDAPDEAVSTDEGTLKFRTKQQLKVTDEDKIPREYLVVDEKALLADLKKGVVVKGAEIEEVQVPVNYR